jgi:hypothetical protein
MQHRAALGVLIGVQGNPVLVHVLDGSLGKLDGGLARADTHVLEVDNLVDLFDEKLLHLSGRASETSTLEASRKRIVRVDVLHSTEVYQIATDSNCLVVGFALRLDEALFGHALALLARLTVRGRLHPLRYYKVTHYRCCL